MPQIKIILQCRNCIFYCIFIKLVYWGRGFLGYWKSAVVNELEADEFGLRAGLATKLLCSLEQASLHCYFVFSSEKWVEWAIYLLGFIPVLGFCNFTNRSSVSLAGKRILVHSVCLAYGINTLTKWYLILVLPLGSGKWLEQGCCWQLCSRG